MESRGSFLCLDKKVDKEIDELVIELGQVSLGNFRNQWVFSF